jgi:hypothetical protein
MSACDKSPWPAVLKQSREAALEEAAQLAAMHGDGLDAEELAAGIRELQQETGG